MNEKEELFDGIIDIPNNHQTNDTHEQNAFNYNFNFETQTEVQPSSNNTTINNNEATPETEILDTDSIDNKTTDLQEKEKILDDLNRDTNNFVNPDLIVNPNVKKIEEEQEKIKIKEPKVDYEGINNKKKLAFVIIIFAIIVVFIMFLPQIVSLLGL